jgi:hypothetical protein
MGSGDHSGTFGGRTDASPCSTGALYSMMVVRRAEPMRISDVLLPVLEERFPGRGLRRGVAPDPVATFPAAHAAVGDLAILDDGGEATVFIGELTHSHFNPYDASLTPKELAEEVTRAVVDFLEALFDDRVVIWLASDGASGGWSTLESGAPPDSHPGARNFVWSGPIDRRESAG